MTPINISELLAEAQCYVCLGMPIAKAIKLALLSRIAEAN